LSEGDLTAEVTGEIEIEDKVLVIKRIHVEYRLRVGAESQELASRIHGFHADFCPVARTIRGCVDITTELDFVAANG